MSNHRTLHCRLTQLAGIITFSFAISTPALAATGMATNPASPSSTCSGSDAVAPAGSAKDSCDKSTPIAEHDVGAWTYTYRTVDYPGASMTIIWGINDFGALSGQYAVNGGTSHAMVYNHGHFEPLDPGILGNYFSAAGGPNDLGTTYGGYADASGHQHGFLIRRHDQLKTIDFPGHLNSNVDGVNVFGAILGVYWDADGVFHGALRRYGNDTPIDYPNAHDTYPLGINSKGDIVGYWDATPPLTHGFYRDASGKMSPINVPDAAATAAFGINDWGQIVGYYADASGGIHGFVETHGQFQNLDVPGATATIATTINNFGVIAGEYFDTSGKRHGFAATPW